jgi:hypothetical protein
VWSAAGNAPVSSGPLGLASTDVNADIHARGVDLAHRHVPTMGSCCQSWALHLPAIAGGTAGVESAGVAEQATTAIPEALGPGAYGKVGGMAHFFSRCRALVALADDIRAYACLRLEDLGCGGRDLVVREKEGEA